MDTIIRPPEAPPEPPISTARRRRWPRRVALGIVLLLVAALVVGVLWAENVEPLRRGSFGWSTTDPRPAAALDLSTFTADDGPSYVNCFEADPGTIVRYRFSIRNEGPVPIRIGSVSPGADDAGMVVSRKPVRMVPDMWAATAYGRQPAWEPFRPFELAPSAEASIEMEATVRERIGQGGSVGIEGEEIHYSIFGIQRVDNFQTPVAVYFAADPVATCSTG